MEYSDKISGMINRIKKKSFRYWGMHLTQSPPIEGVFSTVRFCHSERSVAKSKNLPVNGFGRERDPSTSLGMTDMGARDDRWERCP